MKLITTVSNLYCEQLHQIRFQIEPLFNTIEKQNIKKKKLLGFN